VREVRGEEDRGGQGKGVERKRKGKEERGEGGEERSPNFLIHN